MKLARPSSTVLLALALCAAATATFARGITFGFVWDDHRIIEDSQRMREPSAIHAVFVHPSTWVIGDKADSPIVTYRPTAASTLAIDYALWRGDPRGFHLTNLLLHVACTLALWLLLSSLHNVASAFGLTLLFAVHPVGAEAVTWINGRSESLCLLFGLLTLALASRSFSRSNGRALAIAACFCAALLGKETAIVFAPLALGLIWRGGKRDDLQKGAWSLFAGAAVYFALRTYALRGAEHTAAHPVLALTAIPTLWYRSLQVVLMPVDLGLENLHAWLAASTSYERTLCWLVGATMVASAVALAVRRRWVETVGLAWWLLALVPPSATLAAGGYWPGLNRWVYVALPGLLLAAAPAVGRMRGRTVYVCSVVLALLLAVETQRAISVWAGEEPLLTHMIRAYPDDWYAYSMLARHRSSGGDDEGAVTLLSQGIDACGAKSKLSCQQGALLARLGRCVDSERVFVAGPSCIAVASINAWEAIGVCFANRGALDRARHALSMCSESVPNCRHVLSMIEAAP